MTHQPEWKYVGNLGDATPLEHGGFFVYTDETGVYGTEAEYYDADERTAYRILCERCEVVYGHLAHHTVRDKALAHPGQWVEWFDEHLNAIASAVGMPVNELRSKFCSHDPLELASAYQDLGRVKGWLELDSYPLKLTRREAHERYQEILGLPDWDVKRFDDYGQEKDQDWWDEQW